MSASITELNEGREQWIQKLIQAAKLLDEGRLGMLIKTARDLLAEMPRQTNAEIIPFGRGTPAAARNKTETQRAKR